MSTREVNRLNIQPNERPKKLLDWSIDDVCAFIDDFNFREQGISQLFRDNEVDNLVWNYSRTVEGDGYFSSWNTNKVNSESTKIK